MYSMQRRSGQSHQDFWEEEEKRLLTHLAFGQDTETLYKRRPAFYKVQGQFSVLRWSLVYGRAWSVNCEKWNDRAMPGQGWWALSECSSRKVCSLSACWILESYQHCSTLPLALVLNSSAAMTYRSQMDFKGFGSPQVICLGIWYQSERAGNSKTREFASPAGYSALELSALSWAQGAAVSQEKLDSKTI